MSGLRCEEPVEILKSEVASIHLVEAIKFFLAENYIPCITLAGAAEEVFGKLLNQSGADPIIEISVQEIERLRLETGLPVFGNYNKRDMLKFWNSTKNSLKHHDKDDSEYLVCHPFDDAYMMIRRALFNAKQLNVHIKNLHEFENWLVVNWN